MNITKKEIDKLRFELTLEVAADDYAESYRKRIAAYKRSADFKGFRKGMVPASIIEKVYGGQALAEVVNQVIDESLDNYIKENKLHILGQPLASENQPENEWQKGKDFTFVFDLANYPETDIDVVKADTITRYEITATVKEKDGMKENLKKYYEEKKEETPRTDEEIEKEVAERLEQNYRQQADWRLSKDIRDFYVKKAGIELPEDFLKRWLMSANEGKVTAEQVDKEFPAFCEDFKWQVVRSALMKKFGFEVSEQDIREAASAYVTYQYAMYGLSEAPADMVKEAAERMLQDPKQIDRLAEQVEDNKVMDKIKETATFKNKKIASDKFYELK